jgi:tRNA 2-thiouridine synthesizing protein A
MAKPAAAKEIDVTGLKCPLPVVKASRELAAMKKGERLVVLATDPASVPDMLGWAKADPRVVVERQETREEKGATLYVHTLRRA